MAFRISHLRRWFLGAAIAAVLLVAGTYFYARHRVQNALKQVPEKMGLDIQQSATGFTVSKSEQGRTLFRVQASKAVQFKAGSRAELHDVTITLYGRDSSRFDQIYGDDFEYDQQSGNVTAKGEVQIDLEANPQGLINPDQSPPRDLKNPIHMKTSGLVFNQKTGDAYTTERVDFLLPEATGSAVGIHYVAKTNTLTLDSQVAIQVNQPAAQVTAVRGVITQEPHTVVLDHPTAKDRDRQFSSDEATLFLRSDNSLDHVVANGNILLKSSGPSLAHARSDQMEIELSPQDGSLRSAVLTGNVEVENQGSQPMQAKAGRATFNFSGNQILRNVRAEDQVKILQHQAASGTSSSAQDLEIAASAVDFVVAKGRRLDHAETFGTAQISIRPTANQAQETVATAGKFEASFDKTGQLSLLHGAPDARITNKNPGQPDRVSTSDRLDATFHPGSGIASLVQQGNVAYADRERKAWGDRARYTPADQILILTGSPRVSDGGMTTTARSMRMNRATGEAFAEGDVKSTYSDLKPQANGALLASGSPIHATAKAMSVQGNSAVALYSGNARLWQDANAVDAPSIEFDRDHRAMVAVGTANQSVSTVLEQADKSGKVVPLAVTSSHLDYRDDDRRAHFEGNVVAKSADLTITAGQMDAYLQERGQNSSSQPPVSAGKLDKIIASGRVVITQPTRQATGNQLVYNTQEDSFLLTGGPPSIFDAEHGKITGVSLTLFRHDGRVVVEGSNSSPTVTETRVAR